MPGISDGGSLPPLLSSGMTTSRPATRDADPEVLQAFEDGRLDPAKFPHAEHVRLGYEILARYSFGEAVDRFSRGLKTLAARAGRPEVYHETITVAFLALINERRTSDVGHDWKHFRDNNPDLFDKLCLQNWYSREQLASGLARRVFCLPSRSGDLKSPL